MMVRPNSVCPIIMVIFIPWWLNLTQILPSHCNDQESSSDYRCNQQHLENKDIILINLANNILVFEQLTRQDHQIFDNLGDITRGVNIETPSFSEQLDPMSFMIN